MLGDRITKIPFGRRKSNGAFGKPKLKNNLSRDEGRLGDRTFKHEKIKETIIIKKVKKTLKAKSGHVNLIKPKKKKPVSKNTMTTHMKEYSDWLHQEEQGYKYPCFACGASYSDNSVISLKHLANIDVNKETTFQSDAIEWHHIKEASSDKKNHLELLPLCGNKCHKLGTVLSAHGTPKKFKSVFPIDVQRKYARDIYKDFLKWSNCL